MGRMSLHRPFVGVVGASQCSPPIEELATDVGREIARSDGVLVCGGLGGVMSAAARGAKEAGGFTIGILPGADIGDANPYIDFPIATNIGHARNALIVHTSDVVIAIDGGCGTLSEIALALKIGKSVIALRLGFEIPSVHVAHTAAEAVEMAFRCARKHLRAQPHPTD